MSFFCKVKPKIDSNINHERYFGSLATALFQKNANKESFDWVVSHYATFHLCTNFAAILMFLGILLLILSPFYGANLLLGSLACLIAFKFLLYLSMIQYVYTYQATYKFCTIYLAETIFLSENDKKN